MPDPKLLIIHTTTGGAGGGGVSQQDIDDAVAAEAALRDTAIAAAVTGLLDFKGQINASANPNYPAASKGDAYIVANAGKVGGASGVTVEVGDFVYALADNAGGTQASVGTSWGVVQSNLSFATTRGVPFQFGDGVSVPVVGTKTEAFVPYTGTITSATLLSLVSGSCTITVKKCALASYPGSLASIVAAAKPTLTTAQQSRDTTLTGWTLSVTAGDVLEFTLDTVTSCLRISGFIGITAT